MWEERANCEMVACRRKHPEFDRVMFPADVPKRGTSLLYSAGRNRASTVPPQSFTVLKRI